MNAIRQLLVRVRRNGRRRPELIKTVSMGCKRTFSAWDIGEDTYILEEGIANKFARRPSVLVAAKGDLKHECGGHVMTISTGNHAVAAMPLLDGRFWGLSHLPSTKRSATLASCVLCANVVEGTLEISQRDVLPERVFALDRWLVGAAGLPLESVVLLDRTASTLEHYRTSGCEWRVKPLAWSPSEMRVALAASLKRIGTTLKYYHSVRGVHFMTLGEMRRLADIAGRDFAEFRRALGELVSVYEGNRHSFMRMPKFGGHHEIELFGLPHGVSEVQMVPSLEDLLSDIALDRIGQEEAAKRMRSVVELYSSLLTRPSLADESGDDFVENLYMCVTGEVYSAVGEGTGVAFDDRRTALPGATFVNGRMILQEGADARTEVLLTNLVAMLSKDEIVEYANVYELREDEKTPLGSGRTREVVYKTDMRPIEASLIAKVLASTRHGYGAYVLSRVGALRAMGVSMSDYYRLLRQPAKKGSRAFDFYVRMRCTGEPLDSIPASCYRAEGGTGEDRDKVLAVAALIGDAAAQNMAMKKFDPRTGTPLFGVGKEIYDFDYDVLRSAVMPSRVATCSIRGTFGWRRLDMTDGNMRDCENFYLGHYAHVLKAFRRAHGVRMADLAARFLEGFSYRTKAMAWTLNARRDRFDAFCPPVPEGYRFDRKWRFAVWSLTRQAEDLPAIRDLFLSKVCAIGNELGDDW